MSAEHRTLKFLKEARPLNAGAQEAYDEAKAAYLAVVEQSDGKPVILPQDYTMTELPSDVVTLDPSDPFDAALIPIVETNRRKRKDYSKDGADPFSNFRETAAAVGITGFTAVDSADFNISQKQARISALKSNGRTNNPANESLIDSYLDRAVYSVIALALLLEQAE